MDPEDLREVISAYQSVSPRPSSASAASWRVHGRRRAVYFGYPQAHEDDAERAVRSGLELVQAVGGLKSSAPLQTRVGIATGLVVVGDLVDRARPRSRPSSVRRRTSPPVCKGLPNRTPSSSLRARESFWQPFRFSRPRRQDLKGMGILRELGKVLRDASIESRFEALHASGST